MISISVIIPTYKPSSYLWECLDSLYSQTLSHSQFEVILVLNGCKEPYYREIKQWQANHNEIILKLLHTDVGGVSNARNIGIDKADGEYITFIDDDDYVSPPYLCELLQCANKDTVSLCYPLQFKDGERNYMPFRITDTYEKLCNNTFVNDFQARRFFSGPVYKLIHKDIIGDRRFDTRLKVGEDTLFMYLISDRISKVNFTSRNAIYYRRIRINSATTKRRSFKEHLKSNIIEMKLLTQYHLSNPTKYSFRLYLTRMVGGTYDIIKSLIL